MSPVTGFAKAGGATGIDFEWPGLLRSDLTTLFNDGNDPFTTPTAVGAYGNTGEMEDNSLCGSRAVFDGDGNDMCPLP